MTSFDFEAIGTAWHIDIYDVLSDTDAAHILESVKTRIDLFDKAYSRFRADSLVTEISQKAGVYTLPDDALPMLSLYKDLYDKTDGFFTPLVGNMLADAGYDAEYSLKQNKPLQSPPAWNDVLQYTHPTLIVKQPVILDFGAAGKGYLIDIVGKVLEESGLQAFCIDAGGDILRKAQDTIRVGLENPDMLDEVIGVYPLGKGSICGSAGNRRAWGKFTHIMNPKTHASEHASKAVWVMATSAMLADALATCLFFVEPKELLNDYAFEYVILFADGRVEQSHGFTGELFLAFMPIKT